MLESWRLQVIEAANGLAGLSLFRTHKPSLVITDIMMPVMDGIETLRQIRAIDPTAKIIAMSGGGGEKYPNPLTLAKEMGVAAALEKPFKRQELRAAVSQILDKDL